MNKNPKTINENMLGETALELMEKYSITQLIITDKKKVPTGVVHLHDLVKAAWDSISHNKYQISTIK
jgi:arabinose-5-phosphate isomerase